MTRTLILLLFLATAAQAQDIEISTRPEIVYVEQIAGNLGPVERVHFHIVVHNVSAQPVAVDWLGFELMSDSGIALSGRYSGEGLMALFDSSIDRRRIEPTPKQSLVISPDQRKAVSDVFLDSPAGFFGETLTVEVQFQLDGNAATRTASTTLSRAATFSGRLPFDGTWYVASEHGHLDPHKRFVSEAFAYDFLQIGPNGKSYQREGLRNSDYFAYGRRVLASKDGVVALVRNDIIENEPGSINTNTPGGNVVVIDHGDGQFGYYAHLRPASSPLRVGSRVTAGSVIGEVGNSGDSREPHIHFHVMNNVNADEAQAIPVTFESWKAQSFGTAPVARAGGVLPRGEFVEP